MGFFATVRHTLRVLWRAARELFHEVTGAVFFIIALCRDSVLLARVASRGGALAGGHVRRLRASDDFFWSAVLSRFPACAMNPPADRTVEEVAATGERKERFTTLGGIPLKTVYTQEDLAGHNAEDSIGVPGEFPYTRGIYPTMYRGRLWTMRQYAGFGTAAQSNERFRYLLAKGQTGLSVAFDLPTQIGLDSDHPRAAGEVGKVGVAIDSLEDMETLFDGIPLDRVSTSMTINSTAAILLALYVAVAKKQGANLHKLSGTVQNDILKEYIARGTYIYPPRPAMRIVTDLFAWCRTELPAWNTISISGYHIREAGSTAAQEVAFTLADAIAYVDAAIAAGLAVDEFAPRLSFFFNAHNDLLEEIAKYRAARRLWAHLMRDRFGAQDSRVDDAALSRADRGKLAHRAAAGKQYRARGDSGAGRRAGRLPVAAHQRAGRSAGAAHRRRRAAGAAHAADHRARNRRREYGGPGRRLLRHRKIDGRNRIAREGIHRQKIDALGGMLRAIETGYVQGEIQKAAYEYQRAIERGEQIVVGVNQFVAEKETPIPTLRIDPDLERAQIERVRALRARRDSARAERSRRGSRAPRALRRKLDARHRRRRRSLRHGRRNFRRPAPRLRRVHGVGGFVIAVL